MSGRVYAASVTVTPAVAPQQRPTPLSRVWSGSRVIAEDLTGEDLGDVLELNAGSSAWWVLPRDDGYGASELRSVAQALELDELAVQDLLAEDRRAKYESIGQARLVITNAVSVDPATDRLAACPVSMIATDRILICLTGDAPGFHPAQLLMQQEQLLAQGGVEVAMQLILKRIIHGYEDAVQYLEDASDDLADALFEERPLSRPEQLRAFRLRTALSHLRRLTDPMRTVMADLVGDPPVPAKGAKARPTAVTRRWTVLQEHLTRVANAADALREALSSVFDTSLALADVRMNQVMKNLSGWAAIIAVPTLITSFVGMNVGFPLYGTVTGFVLALGLMIVSAALLYLLFKRREWI